MTLQYSPNDSSVKVFTKKFLFGDHGSFEIETSDGVWCSFVYGEGMRGKDICMVGMVGVCKEEKSELQTKEECQDAETAFCEQCVLKKAAYEQQEERSEGEHVLVE